MDLKKQWLTAMACVLSIGMLMSGCDKSAVEEQELAASGTPIEGQYIIVLHKTLSKSSAAVAADMAATYGLESERFYETALKGFSARIPADQVNAVRRDSRVRYIEQDRVIALGKGKPGGGGGAAQVTPWGITRVGGSASGAGKRAWIIDTGIDLDHPDLNVDVSRSVSFISNETADDQNGHGTHVAGTVAAIDNSRDVVGVAAGATVVAVKVLNRRGSGSYSGVIAGVDYVAANGANGDAANMSLGGPVSQALDDAVSAAAATGVKFALAAGNESDDANNHSPGRTNGANIYTVSAINSSNVFASFSNYGNPPVDWAAPGVSILSLWKGGGTNTISGTSMATPHVCGLLLLGAIHADGNASGDPDGNPDPIAHR